jgi:probable HAF family extracellular repeat protein
MNMKFATLTCIVCVALFAGLANRLAARDQDDQNNEQVHYSVISVGTLGGNLSNGSGINNKGWVVGDANLTGNANEHAVLWRNGVITDLGTLGGPNSSIGFIGAKPNDTGLITGNAQSVSVDPLGEYWGTNFGCTPSGTVPCQGWQYLFLGFAWKDGVITQLPTLGGNNSAASGRANGRGEIVGTAETATPDPNCIAPQVLDWEPVVWEPNGEIRQLVPFPGDSVGAASAINDKGQVVGGSGICESPGTAAFVHPVLWQKGRVTNLGSLGGVMNNLAVSINNRGQVVGVSDLAGDATFHAFLWQNAVMTDLGTLSGDFSSLASEINDDGQVVGQSCDMNFNCRSFLWENGSMTDLNILIPAGSSLHLLSGQGINSRGEIVGSALDQTSGEVLGFLAVPDHNGRETIQLGQQIRDNLILPDNVREWLRQRRSLGGLGSPLIAR